MKNDLQEKSLYVHAGPRGDKATGAVNIPVYLTSTFDQEELPARKPYEYSRGQNPTREALEQAIARLEGGKHGFAFSSGMAAISTALCLFSAGEHVLVTEDCYGGTYRILTKFFSRYGVEFDFIDTTDLEQVKKAIRPHTRGIFVESPSNPLMRITDLAALSQLARERGLLTLIDNTFATPFLQKPLELGIDVVIHSATKYIGGHSDLLAGLIVVRDDELARRLKLVQMAFGAVLSPFDSYLTLRGLKTLAIRMEQQQSNARELALWLRERKQVKRVFYPGFSDHPGAEVHQRQARGPGAVITIDLGGEEEAISFINSTSIPVIGPSLGGVETIITHPFSMSHAGIPAEIKNRLGITPGLVRISVGIEDIVDLQRDFSALDR